MTGLRSDSHGFICYRGLRKIRLITCRFKIVWNVEYMIFGFQPKLEPFDLGSVGTGFRGEDGNREGHLLDGRGYVVSPRERRRVPILVGYLTRHLIPHQLA